MSNEDRELIAHLLRRSGFSANHSDIDSALKAGYEKTVENLLTAATNEGTYEDLLDRFHSEHCDEESPRWSAVKWVFRMINTKNPLEEIILYLVK